MPYWPPDTPPSEPEQMPGAPGPGPAPVPYGGPDWPLAPSMLAPQPDVSLGFAPGATVMDGVTGANYVTEAPLAAPNVNPYAAGSPQAIYVGGDNDAGGRDDVADAVSAAVATAQDRFMEHQGDTYGLGSQIGDSMTLPPKTSDGSDYGGFYDPPRDYGG